MSDEFMSTANIINFFVALGTCSAVAVALIAKGKTSFENTFNILLTQHNESLRKLKEHKDYNIKLKKVFSFEKNFSIQEFNKNMHKHDDFFGSYFRILYHLLKHIDANAGYHRFDFKEKKRYTSLVRSFLDNETTLLLVINCAHAKPENQYYNYKSLIERYAFFEHLILDPEKFNEYVNNKKDTAENVYELMIQKERGGFAKLTKEIKNIYHKTAFGRHADMHLLN